MDKSCILRQIKRYVAENKIEEAIQIAQESFSQYKDCCFLNEIAKIQIRLSNRKEAIKYLKKIYKL